MGNHLATTLAFLTAVAGWFYMFYSKAGHSLATIEGERLNTRRIRLRRLNGMIMFLLAIFIFAGFNTVSPEEEPRAFIAIWMVVCALLASVLLLALIDLRLTMNIRRRRAEGKNLD